MKSAPLVKITGPPTERSFNGAAEVRAARTAMRVVAEKMPFIVMFVCSVLSVKTLNVLIEELIESIDVLHLVR